MIPAEQEPMERSKHIIVIKHPSIHPSPSKTPQYISTLIQILGKQRRIDYCADSSWREVRDGEFRYNPNIMLGDRIRVFGGKWIEKYSPIQWSHHHPWAYILVVTTPAASTLKRDPRRLKCTITLRWLPVFMMGRLSVVCVHVTKRGAYYSKRPRRSRIFKFHANE